MRSEEQVFSAVMAWVRYNVGDRRPYLPQVRGCFCLENIMFFVSNSVFFLYKFIFQDFGKILMFLVKKKNYWKTKMFLVNNVILFVNKNNVFHNEK